MKHITKGVEPSLLAEFRQQQPNATWDECKTFRQDRKERSQQIRSQLIQDQNGLCAYCEIDLRLAEDGAEADFRVEHFHPKSDEEEHNWHLDWQNLLGCCHGGSARNVVDKTHRWTSPDHSCDVPKADKVLDESILNPLQLSPELPLFKFSRASGGISVHTDIDSDIAEKAQNTIVQPQSDLRYFFFIFPAIFLRKNLISYIVL